MGLEIIGAGWGRTGTHSLKIALEQLGFGPCHHMYRVRADQSQLAFWQAALQGAPMDWDRVFAGYRSQVDWPGAHYWRNLLAHFPTAKVILTVREPQSWFESMQRTIFRALKEGRLIDPDPYNRAVSEYVQDLVTLTTFADRTEDRDYMLSRYDAHIKSVQSAVPSDQLLTYDVRQGWQPLCEFLGVPLPDTAFPVTNSTQEFLERKNLSR